MMIFYGQVRLAITTQRKPMQGTFIQNKIKSEKLFVILNTYIYS